MGAVGAPRLIMLGELLRLVELLLVAHYLVQLRIMTTLPIFRLRI